MMANNYPNSNSYNKNRNYWNSNSYSKDHKGDYVDTVQMNLEPMQLPNNYIHEAEDIMRKISRNITTSKIRGFLSLVSKVYNVESVRTEDTLLPDSMDTIQMMRIRIVYEAGRDDTQSVKRFLNESHILNYIKGIGESRKNFIAFARYMEALVAYHKFYGGKE